MSDLQLTLPLGDITFPAYDKGLSLSERFDLFHNTNEWLADLLEQMVDEWLANGHRKVGVGMLFEALRWRSGIQTTADPYKLNNDFRSRYARLLIARRPEWADAIETRELRAA